METTRVKVVLNKYRKSAQKVREVAGILKGQEIDEALAQLQGSKKGYSRDLIKLLNSAVADAKNNLNLNQEDLFIKDFRANEKMTMKRWRPRAYGRAAQILKRTCSVELVLEEKESAKKRKEADIKSELKKIKTKEVDDKDKKEEGKTEEEKGKKGAELEEKKPGLNNVRDLGRKGNIGKGAGNKIFRRKSF